MISKFFSNIMTITSTTTKTNISYVFLLMIILSKKSLLANNDIKFTPAAYILHVLGENFCHTLHIMDSTGASVVVNKKCADSAECVPQGVGCVTIDSQTVSHLVVVKIKRST